MKLGDNIKATCAFCKKEHTFFVQMRGSSNYAGKFLCYVVKDSFACDEAFTQWIDAR